MRPFRGPLKPDTRHIGTSIIGIETRVQTLRCAISVAYFADAID